MFNIMICDDDSKRALVTKELVQKCIQPKGAVNAEFYYAESIEEIEEKIKSLHYVLLFANTMLKGKEVFGFFEKIKKKRIGIDFILIGDDSSSWERGYACHALDFIERPIDESKISAAGEKAIKKYKQAASCAAVKDKHGKNYFIKGSDIVLVEIMNKDLTINLKDGRKIISTRQTSDIGICEISPFMRCHNSFYVNMDYIVSYERYFFTLEDGIKAPISKMNYKQNIACFLEHKRKL